MRLRAYVVVTGLGALNLACAGLTSRTDASCAEITSGSDCWPEERTCMIAGQEQDCGLNGYECTDGAWQEQMTFCNPPPQPHEDMDR
ncbi:MAG: hypothetical protein P8R54_04520 [Myxococcota bacterium]|nr:hypothetical protein [Myxococcota bacterium]